MLLLLLPKGPTRFITGNELLVLALHFRKMRDIFLDLAKKKKFILFQLQLSPALIFVCFAMLEERTLQQNNEK